jgi:hypothetical protein
MKPLLSALILLLALQGCASIPQGVVDVAGSTNTFAICKATDVITTKIALNSGLFHEANPLLAPFIGPHNFVPLILFSVAVWYVLDRINNPKLTMAANVVTCGVAARNAVLINQAGVMH